MVTRRNPRRAAAKPMTLEVDENPASSSSAEDNSSSSEEEDNVIVKRKKTSTRTSSRSTRFQNSMQEPRDSINDLLVGGASSKKTKSPAKSHSSARRRVRTEVPVDSESSEEEEESEDEGDDDEEELLKIQRIVASRSEPRKVWKEICQNMHTTEIEYGSRWYQQDDQEDGETFEERFLVKWSDLSYMHCSWETQHDLIEQVEGAKTYLTTFFKKSDNGLLFTADERCDGDYFDPGFVQVDRILEVHLPDIQDSKRPRKDDDPIEAFRIILDRDNPDFESGTGRQFLVKWKNMPYSDVSYEFERDLILNDIEYLDNLKALEQRNKKVSQLHCYDALLLD